jgi:NAD+ synthase
VADIVGTGEPSGHPVLRTVPLAPADVRPVVGAYGWRVRDLQKIIVSELGVRPHFDADTEVEARVAFLADYLAATGARGYVLGISGGLDSTLAGRLAQLAVERRRAVDAETVFVAVRLPYKVQFDEDDARAALDYVGPDEIVTYNVAAAVDGFEAEYLDATGLPLSDFTKGNTKARLRMVAQYALAGERGLLVVGTDHGSESVTGFFTKFGDGAADVLPLHGLDKQRNRELLRHLGGPERLWAKEPTADLLDGIPGRPDEVELGLTYAQIDAYVEGRDVPVDVAERIEAAWLRTRHKRTTPVTPQDTWWRQ